MHEHGGDIDGLFWFAGWLVAVLALFAAAQALPLESRLKRWQAWFYGAGVALAGVGVAVLANVAIVLNDSYIDVTREKVYTPVPAAMRVVEALREPVRLTYFYRSADGTARRTADLLKVMQQRNPLLEVTVVDPDRDPTLAREQGIRLYNAAVIEAAGRRLLVQGTDEAEIAVGIQRVLRERVITVCFIEGHGELPMENFEFHTHLEGLTDHSHADASSKLVQTTGHGIGRLRRALEAQGYETSKLILATSPDIPADCAVAVVGSPRNTFLPAESQALRRYLEAGGSALLLFDLGFVLEPGLAGLVADLGLRAEQEVVVDPLSHFQTDPEMVAVTGYDPHPVTRGVSLTFFPGIRPLTPLHPADGLTMMPLLSSSRDSYTRPVAALESRSAEAAKPSASPPAAVPEAGPRLLGAAVEGRLPGATGALRVILVGDGDFASNSFFPYMSNSDLLVSMLRWLAHEERSVTVGSRLGVPALLLLTGQQMQAIFVLLVVLLPLAVVLLGGIVWWRRR